MSAPDRRGFALIAVLWALVFLGAVAVEFHLLGQADRAVTANQRAEARARWAARAGLARALSALERSLSPHAGTSRLDSARAEVLAGYRFRQGEVEVLATLRDARARLNPNRAAPGELRALFAALGAAPVEAEDAARRVADWRARYASAGPGPEARAAGGAPERAEEPEPFAAVTDLLRIPGFPEPLFRRAAPYLTVAGDGRINLNTAAAPVLSALPGLDPAAVQGVLELRQRAALQSLFQLQGGPGGAMDPARAQATLAQLADRAAFGPREVQILVVARLRGSPVESRLEAVVLLSGGNRVRVLRVVEH